MPRQNKIVERILSERTLVVDNGAYTIKAGFATTSPRLDVDCHEIPNCISKSRDKKIWIGAQIEKCKDFGEMSFRRPVEKGYMVNWEAEKEIWHDSFLDATAKLTVSLRWQCAREYRLILPSVIPTRQIYFLPNLPIVLQPFKAIVIRLFLKSLNLVLTIDAQVCDVKTKASRE